MARFLADLKERRRQVSLGSGMPSGQAVDLLEIGHAGARFAAEDGPAGRNGGAPADFKENRMPAILGTGMRGRGTADLLEIDPGPGVFCG